MTLDLRKPAPGSGRVKRYQNRVLRRSEKAKADRRVKLEELKSYRAVRHSVYLRDGRKCRAFGVPVLFETDNLLKQSHAHHVIFRSAGGSGGPENLLTVSVKAHEMLHRGELEVTGDPNGTVTFTQYEFADNARRVVRVWEG